MVNELILQEIEVFSDVFSMMIANIEFQSTYKVWKPPICTSGPFVRGLALFFHVPLCQALALEILRPLKGYFCQNSCWVSA